MLYYLTESTTVRWISLATLNHLQTLIRVNYVMCTHGTAHLILNINIPDAVDYNETRLTYHWASCLLQFSV